MPAVAGDGNQLAVDIGPGRARGGRTKAGGVELPRQLELLEVRGVDLVGRRVAGVPRVAAEVGPLPVLCARALRLGRGLAGEQRAERQYGDDRGP